MCNSCDIEFELFHSMSDNSIKNCPQCGLKDIKKLISGGGAVIIKGTTTPCKQTGQRPQRNLKKLGSNENSTIPSWRSSSDGKVRKDILKNPDKYIFTGET